MKTQLIEKLIEKLMGEKPGDSGVKVEERVNLFTEELITRYRTEGYLAGRALMCEEAAHLVGEINCCGARMAKLIRALALR